MSKLIGAATVCECGNAIWRLQAAKEGCLPCALFPNQCVHDFEYVCTRCGELLETTGGGEVFCPTNANLLQWDLCSEEAKEWFSFSATHLVCFRCDAEDRNISYDWLSARKNLWLPKWRAVDYYGITVWKKAGAGPWMEELIFCANCADKKDLECWLKKYLGLVLLKKGNASPHKLSELAKEMRKNFPHIPLEPSPWG